MIPSKRMTAEEIAKKLVTESAKRWIKDEGDGFSCNLDILMKDIEYELTQMIAQERERCAKIADQCDFHFNDQCACMHIAAAIRGEK